MPETGTHSAATGPIVNSPAVGEVSSPIRPDTRLALPRLPAPQATPVWAGAAVRAGAGTPGAAAASGAASAARPAQGPIFVSEPQHGPTAGGLGSSGRGPASPVLVPTGKRSKPAQGTERRRPDGPFIPALTGPPLPVMISAIARLPLFYSRSVRQTSALQVCLRALDICPASCCRAKQLVKACDCVIRRSAPRCSLLHRVRAPSRLQGCGRAP